MKDIKLFERTLSGQFQLDLHTDYQNRIYDVIHGIAPAKILLEAADIDKWNAGIKDQNEIAREVRAAKETEDLVKKDEERDKIITSLFQEIRQAAQSPIAARHEAGRTLKLIVKTYDGLQKERWAGETVHTSNLLDDLAKPEPAAAVTTLGLTELVNLLRTTNDAFNALRESRTTKAAATILPTSVKIRAQNDAMTFAIFRHIEAAYITAATDEDRKAIGEVIDQVNARIREAKATYNQSMAHRKPKEKKPKDPKQPKDPKEPEKPGGGDDIQIPSEPPKKPDDAEQPKPNPGGQTGGGDDIQIPSEPPKKPDGQ